MAGFPHANKVNFFAAIDKWQAAFVLQEATQSGKTTSEAVASAPGPALTDLSVSMTQLLFSEPGLLDQAEIAQLIDRTAALPSLPRLPNITLLGLTPLLARCLGSPISQRREWARGLLPAAGKRKLSFELFERTGVLDETIALCVGLDGTSDSEDGWKGLAEILGNGCLSDEAIDMSVLREETFAGQKRGSKGIMTVLIARMGTESDSMFSPARSGA